MCLRWWTCKSIRLVCRWDDAQMGKPADGRLADGKDLQIADSSVINILHVRVGCLCVSMVLNLHILSGDEVSSACVADSSKRLPNRHATVLRLPPTVPVGCGSKRCHANGCQKWLPEAAAKCCHYCQCIWHALVSRQLRRRLLYHNRYSSTDAVFPGSLQCQSVHFTRACAAHL